jgi:CubicO group peptidase (beta-lactamase class C family)
MRGAVIEPDASGTPVGGARGLLRPVDWRRLGELLAPGGSWQEVELLSPDWVSFMTAASPASAEYGGSLWRVSTPRRSADLRARLPADTVFFAGHLGQYLVVVPSERIVVLRMGVSLNATMASDSARDDTFELVAALVQAR